MHFARGHRDRNLAKDVGLITLADRVLGTGRGRILQGSASIRPTHSDWRFTRLETCVKSQSERLIGAFHFPRQQSENDRLNAASLLLVEQRQE
jgi:hypothetical protein